MKQVSRIVLCALLTTILFAPGSAPAWSDRAEFSDGVEWEYFEEGDGYYRTPEGEPAPTPGPSGPPKPDENGFFWKTEVGGVKNDDGSFSWWCTGDRVEPEDTGDTRDGYCENTTTGQSDEWYEVRCASDGERPEFPNIRLRQHKDWHDQNGPAVDGDWDYVDEPYSDQCVEVGDDDWVSTEDITEEVDYSVFQQLGKPKITTSPGAQGVVKLPTVVSTDYLMDGELPGSGEVISRDPLRIRVPVDVEKPGKNLVGEITAEAKLSWSFEGSQDVQHGRGRKYTEAVDPVRDTTGYYVSHTFDTIGPKTITLDVRWTGQVRVDGLEPEPIDPVDLPAVTTQLPIVELDTVLGQ